MPGLRCALLSESVQAGSGTFHFESLSVRRFLLGVDPLVYAIRPRDAAASGHDR